MKKYLKKKIILPVIAVLVLATGTSFKSDFFEIAKQLEIFTTLFKELNMNYVDETNPAELMDKAIGGMLDGLDPYTVYWTEQEVETSRIRRRGSYTGIGASVNSKKGELIIVEPTQGLPADLAGLKAGDKIIKIDDITVSDYQENAGDLLKGAQDSEVTIVYERQGKKSTVQVKRAKVDVDAVPHYGMIGTDVGYIVLSKFNAKASGQTAEALGELKDKGAKKIILDLRGNPGGLLSEAVNVSSIFLPQQSLITTTKSSIEKYNKTYYTKKPPIDLDIPVAVLINGRSASASEIVSGSLQDYDRGVVVGARSFGKGLVQRPKPLTYGTQLKVTISRYFTPSGRCIQALDYWNRDENGDPVRTLPENFQEFKTTNGRKVYDGGGVAPDVDIAAAAYSPITTALLRDNAIFEYATDYYYNNQVSDLQGYKFTDADFETFIQWLSKNGFNYETETEKDLKKALATAKKEELDDALMSQYNSMLTSLSKAKNDEIRSKKAEVKRLLQDEILKRYFYREGVYEYQMQHSPEILEAISILNDDRRYSKILKK